jgi:hypothetical protein
MENIVELRISRRSDPGRAGAVDVMIAAVQQVQEFGGNAAR